MRARLCAYALFLCFILIATVDGTVALTLPLSQQVLTAKTTVEVEPLGSLGKRGIFVLSEGVPTVRISIAGSPGLDELRFSYWVYDHTGRLVIENTRPVALGGDGRASFEVALSDITPGWFRLVYEVGGPTLGRAASGRRDIAVLSGRPAGSGVDSPFGMWNGTLTDYEADILRHIGVKSLYGAVLPGWAETQFQRAGHYIWRARREEQTHAEQAGLSAVGPIGEVPRWVQTDPDVRAVYLSDFFGFVKAYRDAVKPATHVSVGATPDAVDVGSFADYVFRTKVASSAAAADTRSSALRHVVEVPGTDLSVLETLLEHGLHLRADVLLIQLTDTDLPPEQYDWEAVKAVQTLWNSRGGRASLWTVTTNPSLLDGTGTANGPSVPEASLSALRLFGPSTPSETDDILGQMDPPVQAEWLVRSHLLQIKAGIDRIFAGPFSTGPSGRRLFSGGDGAYPDSPQRPRPALVAYATMIEQLSGAMYVGRLDVPGDIWALVFARYGEVILVLWTTREQATLELSNLQVDSVVIIDPMGASHTEQISDHRLRLQLGPAPMYVRGLDAGILAQALTDEFAERVAGLERIHEPAGPVGVEASVQMVHELATELWLHVLAGNQRQSIIERWRNTVQHLFALGDYLVEAAAADPTAQAALYELYDLLPVLAEVGAALGTTIDAAAAPAEIDGTEVLLKEAVAAFQKWVEEDGTRPVHAEKLLAKTLAWWEGLVQAPPSAQYPWAIVARGAAALAMTRAERETNITPGLFLSVPRLVFERAFPGVAPVQRFGGQKHWEQVQNLLSDWFAPLAVDQAPLLRSIQQTGNLDEPEPDVSGWDELSVPLRVVNLDGKDVTGVLELEVPPGWLVRLDDEVVVPEDHGATVTLAFPGAADRGTETVLDLGFLVPQDAQHGEYVVPVRLRSPSGLADEVVLSVRIDDLASSTM